MLKLFDEVVENDSIMNAFWFEWNPCGVIQP